MSTDNRTQANAADSVTNWLGQGKEALNTTVGQRYEGTGAIEDQHSNADEDTYVTVITGTPVDQSDMTVYGLIKDNLVDTFANGGIQFLLGDGTDRIGYDVAGNDAVGLPLPPFYNAIKLDVSNKPGSFTVYAGTEANLTLTAITAMGYGTLHLAKAVGSIANCYFDSLWYIANDSYALTVNGGTVGTPETMSDVSGDDITNGWGMIGNPLGDQYQFFAPTEWGESAANADHFFAATDEQWFWIGDNSGGHAVGATHFPFRVIGNATDTGLFQLTRVSITNTGTASEFDCSSGDVDTLEIDTCTMIGLASFEAPSSGGTSRYCTSTVFAGCGQVTHNGASMNGCSFLESTVATNGGALVYNEATDPDGETDNQSFVQGTNAHHAYVFGTSSPTSITITGADFSGFSASDDNDGSVFRFERTSGAVTLNLVGCTNDGSGFTVDDRAGCTVTVVIDPVTLTITAVDGTTGDAVGNARVLAVAASTFTGGASVTSITRSGSTATVTQTAHGYDTGDEVRIYGADQPEYNKIATITVTGVNAYTYAVSGTPVTATGTIVSALVIINGYTNGSGVITDTRSWGADQDYSAFVRRGTYDPVYVSQPVSGTISATAGASATAPLSKDG